MSNIRSKCSQCGNEIKESTKTLCNECYRKFLDDFFISCWSYKEVKR